MAKRFTIVRMLDSIRFLAARSGEAIVCTSIVSSTRCWQAGNNFRSRCMLPRFTLAISTQQTRQAPTGSRCS